MRWIVMRWLCLPIVLCTARIAAADYVNGASDEVQQADAVLLGHAQSAAEDKAWAAPAGHQRIVVDEVLVGVWFERSVVLDGAPLAASGRVVVLVQPRELHDHPELAVEPPPARPAPRLWPLGPGDALPPDLVAHGDDAGLVRFGPHAPLGLADLRAIAAKTKPGEVGLTAKVIDAALLHPAPDPIAALYDLDRDVPALAALLESPVAGIRDAAAARLEVVAHDKVARAAHDTPGERAAWRQRWLDWWTAHRDGLLAGRAYPPLPVPLAAPKVREPAALLAALDGPPAKLTAAVRAWLDGSVIRDRELRGATADEQASKWPGADIVGLSYSTPRGSGSLDELLDRKLPAKQRMAALASRVLQIHADRFAAERALAARKLEALAPCAPDVLAAAYWEAHGAYMPGPAATAILRLAACAQPAATGLLEASYRLRPDDAVITAVAARVATKDRRFAERLAAHVRTAGPAVQWAISILNANGYDKLTIPIARGWLASKDAEARLMGAASLDQAGAAAALPLLLAAVAHETDDGARRWELSTIARVADKRALAALLAAAKAPAAKDNRIAIANGLARIKDARALDALARLALDAGDQDLQGAQEAVNAFCWISGRCAGRAPSDSPGGSVDPPYIKSGLDEIRAWQARKQP